MKFLLSCLISHLRLFTQRHATQLSKQMLISFADGNMCRRILGCGFNAVGFFSNMMNVHGRPPGALLLTWFNFNPGIDK